MTEKELGTQNIKELVVLNTAIMIPIMQAIGKDGFQPTDLFAFLGSEEFKKAVGPAVKDIGQVYAEAKNIDLTEGLDLGAFVIQQFGQVIKAYFAAKKK